MLHPQPTTATLFSVLKTYVAHKQQVFYNSKRVSSHQRCAIAACKRLVLDFEKRMPMVPLKEVAQMVLANEKNLTEILPHENNKSYISSSETLKQLIEQSQITFYGKPKPTTTSPSRPKAKVQEVQICTLF
jgi:hypothetical protein